MFKKDYDYFQALIEISEQACNCAVTMEQMLINLNDIDNKVVEVHKFESLADEKYHSIVEALNKAFVTPLDREDIMTLAHTLDDVVDAIDDTVLHFYMLNITSINPAAVEFCSLVLQMTEVLKETMCELKNYKKSKLINKLFRQINDLEEKGDKLHTQALRKLFVKAENPAETFKWKCIFDIMEEICDACEHCADQIEIIIMKNS